MNYFALVLDNNSYVEKCLTLIRFISNPDSNSLPHITIRTFNKQNSKLDYTRDTIINHLDIVEPGTYNIEENEPPYVVYIKCESDELEEIKYKPDYPFSRLHITLYEGNNIYYAKELYALLCKRNWRFRLPFEKPRGLDEKKIGSKKNKDFMQNVRSFFYEIIGSSFDEFYKNSINCDFKLNLIIKVLNSLYDYIAANPEKVIKLESRFFEKDKNSIGSYANYIDASKNNITYKDNQLSFDLLNPEKAPYVEKPVQDAIYVTPPEYAREMAICALEAFGNDSRKIDFGDSAIGTGALFFAIRHLVDDVNVKENKKYMFNSAIGIDIDEEMAKEAFIRCEKHGLTVIYGDAISPDINLGLPRNLMVVNPPYNRHENIPKDYRLQAYNLAKEQTGICIRGDAGLYVYHLLIMDKWLSQDGVAVWLLPSIFLQSRYGEAIRQYLLNNVQLIKLHVYDDKKIQFDNTFISTTIVAFRKQIQEEPIQIAVSYGDSAIKPLFNTAISKKTLQEASGNWRKVIYNDKKKQNIVNYNPSGIKFEDLFDIKRGLATGANSFFIMKRSDAKKRGIPDFALKPLLPKARYLNSMIVKSKDDGYPDVEPQLVLIDCDLDENTIRTEYPNFFDYLQIAKKKGKDGKSITERTLVKGRHPWYKQERRDPPPFLLTYMGRNKKELPPLYFILNKSEATALNTYLLLYPKKWLMNLIDKNSFLYETILSSLNNSAKIFGQQTRVYSGGLQKLEPGELKMLPVADLPDEVIKAFNNNLPFEFAMKNT